MASIGQAVLDLVGDDTRLQQDVDEAKRKVSSSMVTIGDAMTQAGVKATFGLTVPLLGMGGAAVNASSDLQESMNAVQVVFGDSADSVLAFSDQAAESAGLAASEFNQMAAQTGAMLVNMGYSQEEAADQALVLTQRAADMASIFNTDVNQALGAVQAGLRGEADPLERFGVRMNAAAVTAQAMKMGLVESAEEMDANAKAQASLALLMEQTDTIAGDFVNTSDGLANSTRIAKAELINQAAALGQQLIPVALQLVTILRSLLDRFSNMSPQMQQTVVIIGAVAAAIGPVLIILGTMISTIGTLIGSWGTITTVLGAVAGVLTGPVALAIAAIVAVVAGWYLAWKHNLFGIRDIFDKVWKAIKTIFDAFRLAFEGDWYGFGEKLREAWDMIWGMIIEGLVSAFTKIKDLVLDFLIRFGEWWFSIDWMELGTNIIKGIANGILNSLKWIEKAAVKAAKAAFNAAKGFLGIESPSTLMEKEIGWNMGMGIKVGWENSLASLNRSMAASLGGLTPSLAGAAVQPGGFGGNQETHLHVGVLVADDRGLMELERKLRPIRETENQRRGTE